MSQSPKESNIASRKKSSFKRKKSETDKFAEDKYELEVSENEAKSARETKSRKRCSSSVVNYNCRKKKRKHQDPAATRKKSDKAMTSTSSMMSRVDVDYAPPPSHYRAMTSSPASSLSCSKKPPKRSSVVSGGRVDVVKKKKKSFETKQNCGLKKNRTHSENLNEKVS